MSLQALSNLLLQQLTQKGLAFERSSTPDGALTFLHPRNWNAAWREDHVTILHGVPPKGWLTIYPVPLRQKLNPADLMDAFLDEFVEPAVTQLSVLQRRRLERDPDIECAEMRLEVAGKSCLGMALARVQGGQARVVSYWVDEGLFRSGPVEDLLLVVLGTLETPAGSRFAERSAEIRPIVEEELWAAPPASLPLRFGAQRGRFALHLPSGWQGVEVSHDGAPGWVLIPPGFAPGPQAPFLSLTGTDLLAPLEETLELALKTLIEGDTYQCEIPAREVSIRDHFALLQIWRGEAPGLPGTTLRLWSLGITDGVSVVHFFAVAEANALLELLPTLTQIGRSVKVLPRVPNIELSQSMTGYWRFIEGGDKETEGLETCLHLQPTGGLARLQRGVNAREAVTHRPPVETLLSEVDSGRWEIVDSTLTLYHADGTRELFEIESEVGRSAIVGGTFWERL